MRVYSEYELQDKTTRALKDLLEKSETLIYKKRFKVAELFRKIQIMEYKENQSGFKRATTKSNYRRVMKENRKQIQILFKRLGLIQDELKCRESDNSREP